MIQKVNITAYHIAENIDIKKFRYDYTGTLHSSSSTELFYDHGNNSFVYLFNYGAIAFANLSDVESSAFINLLKAYCKGLFPERYREEFQIVKSPEFGTTYHTLNIPDITPEIIKVTMLNVAQSVTMDYYTDTSQQLLKETGRFTTELELYGSIRISKRNLLRFIGKTLNLNNRIIDNLYVLDVPEILWENESLWKINAELEKVFDTKMRFKEIEYTVKIVGNNLSIFTELNLHKETSMLERTIILLILIEIINMFVEKLI